MTLYEKLQRERREGREEVVEMMLQKGSLSLEEISEYSGFTVKEIEEIRDKVKA